MNLFNFFGISRKDIDRITTSGLKTLRDSMARSNKDYVSHRRSQGDRAECPHSDWSPETRENNWRSRCLKCGEPAQGSCQG